jgi:hypothetical protein
MNATEDNTNGKVSFTFDHAMAKVTFSARYTYDFNEVLPEVYIDAIELSGLAESNTLRFTSTGYAWDTPQGSSGAYRLEAAKGDLVTGAIIRDKDTGGDDKISTTQGTFCLLPQTISGNTVTTDVTFRIYDVSYTIRKYIPAGQWEAGGHYHYVFNVDVDGKVWNFAHTDAVETFTAPQDGTYRIEVWGGKGGNGGTAGFNGNYAKGSMTLHTGDVLYVCVGSAGGDHYFRGGTNQGGGAGGVNPAGGSGGAGNHSYRNNTSLRAGGGGGAASDVRTSDTDISGINLDDNPTVDTRIIVAGGGGGGCGVGGSNSTTHTTTADGAGGLDNHATATGGHASGGGGGGYRGGGQDAASSRNGNSGVSYVDGNIFTDIVQQEGVRSGDGLVSITLLPL